MPDLENQIREWRERMLAAGIKSPVPLEELENHLRDDIEQQVKVGVGEDQAFKTAAIKIGEAKIVSRAFEKNFWDGTTARALFFSWGMFTLFCAIMDFATAKGTHQFSLLNWMLPILAATYVAWLPFCYRRLFARYDRIAHKTMHVISWVLPIWSVLVLLDALKIIRLGDSISMRSWWIYMACIVTDSAYRAYKRNRATVLSARM